MNFGPLIANAIDCLSAYAAQVRTDVSLLEDGMNTKANLSVYIMHFTGWQQQWLQYGLKNTARHPNNGELWTTSDDVKRKQLLTAKKAPDYEQPHQSICAAHAAYVEVPAGVHCITRTY